MPSRRDSEDSLDDTRGRHRGHRSSSRTRSGGRRNYYKRRRDSSSSSSSNEDCYASSRQRELIVGGLTPNVTVGHIEEIFGTFGRVAKVTVHTARNEERYAEIIMESEEGAAAACRSMDQGQIDGRQLCVNWTRRDSVRSGNIRQGILTESTPPLSRTHSRRK